MSLFEKCLISVSSLIELWKIRHEKVDFYVTVRPEEKDDKGFLGYKWRGLVYPKRTNLNEFIPIESCKLYRSPKKAIQECTQYYYDLQAMLDNDDDDN